MVGFSCPLCKVSLTTVKRFGWGVDSCCHFSGWARFVVKAGQLTVSQILTCNTIENQPYESPHHIHNTLELIYDHKSPPNILQLPSFLIWMYCIIDWEQIDPNLTSMGTGLRTIWSGNGRFFNAQLISIRTFKKLNIKKYSYIGSYIL